MNIEQHTQQQPYTPRRSYARKVHEQTDETGALPPRPQAGPHPLPAAVSQHSFSDEDEGTQYLGSEPLARAAPSFQPQRGEIQPRARAKPYQRSRPSVGAKPLASSDTGCLRNVVVMESASGGVGLSTSCAMLALEMSRRGRRCALVDADFRKGGLDVLLGLENDEGLRFGGIDLPLGQVSGSVLVRQLPQWEGIAVLSFSPWEGEAPEWWNVQAVLQALSRTVDVVIVDAGTGLLEADIPELARSPRVVVTELSVLGANRARILLGLSAARESGSGSWPDAKDADGERLPALAVLGVEPRGTLRGRGVVSCLDASEFLEREVVGPVRPDVKSTGDLLEGLGLQSVPKGAKTAMRQLADCVEEQLRAGDEP